MRERHRLPGVRLVEPSRLRPRLHYELLACAVSGHALIGIDARRLSPDDALVEGIEAVGLWYQRRRARYPTSVVLVAGVLRKSVMAC